MKCSVDGCAKEKIARGWCHAHYKKWRLHGSPTHGKSHARANGEGTINWAGYVAVTHNGKKRLQHHVVAEAAIGRPLPAGAVVHHVDGNPLNNAPSNLVVCPDQSYHKLIHMRQNALEACGNPSHRRCFVCREYDSVDQMTRVGDSRSGHKHYHRACLAVLRRREKEAA